MCVDHVMTINIGSGGLSLTHQASFDSVFPSSSTNQLYVDDNNVVMEELPPGIRLVDGKFLVVDGMVETDRLVKGDKRTAELAMELANTLCPYLQMEVDYPSNHPSALRLDAYARPGSPDDRGQVCELQVVQEEHGNGIFHPQPFCHACRHKEDHPGAGRGDDAKEHQERAA